MTRTVPHRYSFSLLVLGLTMAASSWAPAMAEDADGTQGAEDAAQEQTVLRAQVLLERVHFSPGQIDGEVGSNFTGALAGFQRSRDLADDGQLGPDTWAELERDAVPTLVEYTLTDDDVAGPFEELPEGLPERAALPALGYTSVEEALGERFHASPDLLRTLNPDANMDEAGQVLKVPNVLEISPLPTPAKIVVRESEGVLLLLDDEDTVLAQFPASMGTEHDPLPIGDWTVTSVVTDPSFDYDPALLRDADQDSEPVQLPPGPNNPVGTVWIGISKPHYGIHGTNEPALVGKTQSNGCIRLTNWSARQLTAVASNGMVVELRE